MSHDFCCAHFWQNICLQPIFSDPLASNDRIGKISWAVSSIPNVTSLQMHTEILTIRLHKWLLVKHLSHRIRFLSPFEDRECGIHFFRSGLLSSSSRRFFSRLTSSLAASCAASCSLNFCKVFWTLCLHLRIFWYSRSFRFCALADSSGENQLIHRLHMTCHLWARYR